MSRVVTVQFVTAGGTPVPVDGGKIFAYSMPDFNYAGVRSAIPAAARNNASICAAA